ncbi:uncharacterized protein LOC122802455 [Protopterus annectens]|uniref:uncharacterized protein LOC122802455 n=1 Tax=Protopterus annectens TaxID=7888 RepID=UPI001CFB55C4|nr:uncharacterized protein LOC122802455 [Protopterus annectens]
MIETATRSFTDVPRVRCTIVTIIVIICCFCPWKGVAILQEEDIIATLGENVNLTSKMAANQTTVKVVWQKYIGYYVKDVAVYYESAAPELYENFKNRINITVQSLNQSTITIFGVRKEDEGCYKCIFIGYPSGSVEQKTCLKVYEKEEKTEPSTSDRKEKRETYVYFAIVIVIIMAIVLCLMFRKRSQTRDPESSESPKQKGQSPQLLSILIQKTPISKGTPINILKSIISARKSVEDKFKGLCDSAKKTSVRLYNEVTGEGKEKTPTKSVNRQLFQESSNSPKSHED